MVFFLEMILKLMVFGPKGYVKSRWNIFDGFIVIISVIDLMAELLITEHDSGLSVLRTFRLVCTSIPRLFFPFHACFVPLFVYFVLLTLVLHSLFNFSFAYFYFLFSHLRFFPHTHLRNHFSHQFIFFFARGLKWKKDASIVYQYIIRYYHN